MLSPAGTLKATTYKFYLPSKVEMSFRSLIFLTSIINVTFRTDVISVGALKRKHVRACLLRSKVVLDSTLKHATYIFPNTFANCSP